MAIDVSQLKKVSNPSQLRGLKESDIIRVGKNIYLKNSQVAPKQAQTPKQTGGLPSDIQSIIDQYASQLKQNQPKAPTPFDQTGLYNEADASSQALAEYNPYFQEQLSKLTQGYATQKQRQEQDLQTALSQIARQRQYAQQEAQKANEQKKAVNVANYVDRGLLRSGAYNQAQQDVQTGADNNYALQRALENYGQQETSAKQQYDRYLEDAQRQQEQQQKDIEQQRLQSLAEYRNRAYVTAYQKYLQSLGQY